MDIYYCACDIAKSDCDQTVIMVVKRGEENRLEFIEEVVLQVKGKSIYDSNQEYQGELLRIENQYKGIKVMEG